MIEEQFPLLGTSFVDDCANVEDGRRDDVRGIGRDCRRLFPFFAMSGCCDYHFHSGLKGQMSNTISM